MQVPVLLNAYGSSDERKRNFPEKLLKVKEAHVLFSYFYVHT